MYTGFTKNFMNFNSEINMPDTNSKKIVLLDKFIFGSLVLFLLTLSNSIFLNQLGYYGALILIVIRYRITGENKFCKTGLELFFLAFIVSEIISTTLSLNVPLAINNFLKRILLIPIIYTMIAATRDEAKLKLEFKIFIGAAIVSMGIYLFNAYKYYIYNMYSVESSGPSVFQYPITTSEIMSFVVIYLFTFLINEKTGLKYRVLNFILFSIASLALFSTYKRTGWLGAAAGILFVVILGRKWKLLVPLVAAAIIIFVLSKNESMFQVFNIKDGVVQLEKSTSTEGRASDILLDSNKFYLADFDKGIIQYKPDNDTNEFHLQAPVVSLANWNDSTMLAYLIDTRFVVLDKMNDNLKVRTSFISPGQTNSFQIANGFLYALDSDSGLTVFRTQDKKNFVRFPELGKFHRMIIDTNYAIFYSLYNRLRIYRVEDGLPVKLILDKEPKNKLTGMFFYKRLFLADNKSLGIYKIENDSVKLVETDSRLKNLFEFTKADGEFISVDLTGKVYSIKLVDDSKVSFKLLKKLDYLPASVTYGNHKLYLTYSKVSRLLSIFDKYNPSNFNRLALWRAGFKIFRDYPVFGVGDIDLAFLYVKYKNDYDKEVQGHMHNNYIHVLVTLGAFGFIILSALMIKVFLLHVKIYRVLKNIPFVSSYALGSAACFIAFNVSGLTEMNIFDHEIITMVWFTLGLNLAFYFRYKPGGEGK
jgi:O-antigen ligase